MKYHLNTPDKELLDDLRKVALEFIDRKMTRSDYNEKGKFSSSTFEKRYGSWNKALEKAGVEIGLKRNVNDNDLFENIETVWIQLGRQPVKEDMKAPLSKHSIRPYQRRFGTWRKALEAFVEFIDSVPDENEDISISKSNAETTIKPEIEYKHKTKRQPSERLKVQVLMRDGNKCRLCGTTITGADIHFDHILPWSKGGETTLENLQVLCAPHNLAKGNYDGE